MHKLAKTILFGALMLIAVRGECSGSRVSIGTNTIGYLAFATPNLDLGVSLHRHWSIHLQGKYNPFWWDVAGAQFQHRQLTASLGARYWPWYVFSGWNYGASFQYSLYNIFITYKTKKAARIQFGSLLWIDSGRRAGLQHLDPGTILL